MPREQESNRSAADRLARRCGVRPNQVQDAYPCTNLQIALVAASLHKLGDYTSRFVFDVSGRKGIKEAFEQLHASTPILRTRVVEVRDQFLQVVVKEPLDWQEANDLDSYLLNDRQTSSVTLGGALARFAWIEEDQNDKTYMVWSLHHCQYDDWSFQLLVQDLNAAASSRQWAVLDAPQRTPFSKFIKALNKVDVSKSQEFWKDCLQSTAHCQSICPSAQESQITLRTSTHCEKSYNLQLRSAAAAYQPSVLAVASWSLIISHLSASSHALFGHVLSGRTSDLQGIQEICGPTLVTVPWCITAAPEDTIAQYLDQLQELRTRVLPFEQTGLSEYRRLSGSAAFETLLSVRVVQDDSEPSSNSRSLQPQKPDPADQSHPCAIFLEVNVSGEVCRLKTSYDERIVASQQLNDVMDKFVAIMETATLNLNETVRNFCETLALPKAVERASHHFDSETTNGIHGSQESDLDPDMFQKVRNIALDTVGVKDDDSVTSQTTLMQLGMDSLKTVLLSNRISKAFDVSIPFKDISGPGRSLSSIGKSVTYALQSRTGEGSGELDVSLLDKANMNAKTFTPFVPEQSHKEDSQQRHSAILLTGATGYLGIEILGQLMASSSCRLILPIRCQDSSNGLKRIITTAENARWDASKIKELHERVEIWPSDLAEERLGLSHEHWLQLTNDCSSLHYELQAIIHNGAKVHFGYGYTDLEDANVRSTALLLQAHMKWSGKPSFVFVTGGRPCPLVPDDTVETAKRLRAAPGYAQTKFVSEVLVHMAKESYQAAGLRTNMSIVHPGSIIGGKHTGVANADDFIWRYVAASIGMRCFVPAVPTQREWINLTPIDLVATEIVSRACQRTGMVDDKVDRCLIRGGLPVCQFWDVVVETLAESLQLSSESWRAVSEWEWLLELEADLRTKGKDQRLFALSQLLLQGQLKGIGGLAPQVSSKKDVKPDTAPVRSALKSNLNYLCAMNYFSGQESRMTESMFVRSKR